MSSSDQGDQESIEAPASDVSLPGANSDTTVLPTVASDTTTTNPSDLDQAADAEAGAEGNLEEEKPRGPIRKAFGVVSTIFWSLIILAAVVFVWPPTWGGPITVTVVQGHSMEPLYYTGDVVIAVRNYSNEYAIGDIIVYKAVYDDVEGMVIHRIIEQLPNGNYITQGDNKPMPDPWEIIPSNIFGKAVVHISGLAKWLGLIRTPVFIGIITGAIVIWVLWPRSNEDEDDDEDEDEDAEGQDAQGPDAGNGDGSEDESKQETTNQVDPENQERSPNP